MSKTKKPWGGRFKEDTDSFMLTFSESISFDHWLAELDCQGSMAHAKMLGAVGIISKAEAGKLIRGLKEVLAEAQANKLPLRMDLEDIHMNIEARLKQKVGDVAGKLHTARSRNDQVALDLRLYFREETAAAIDRLTALCRTLTAAAEKNLGAIMPGYTHTRKAQPVLFSHHLLAYVEMFLRDRERFADCLWRMNLCPLGAGAIAGSTFPIDREMVAVDLGFSGVTQNSIDSVSDRDFLLEFGAAASISMVHLSRMMEELIWWGLPEMGFVELAEAYCTGSSMMPNKKNPDAAELTRGKSGRVVGSLVSLLLVMKGTPLSYNRDFQEDKEGMFDAARTLNDCLRIAERLIGTMQVFPERMRRACATGFVLATDLADYLASKGMPFREAHEVTGKLVRHCEDKGTTLEALSLAELRQFSPVFAADVKGWLTLEASVKKRASTGGTAPAQVKKQIGRLKKMLGNR